MKSKFLILLAICVFFTPALNAMDESMNDTVVSSAVRHPRGYQELKILKNIHQQNEIFDNYQLGGMSPELTKKGQ